MNIHFKNTNRRYDLFNDIAEIDNLVSQYAHLQIKDLTERDLINVQNSPRFKELNQKEKQIATLLSQSIDANRIHHGEKNVTDFVHKLFEQLLLEEHPFVIKNGPEIYFEILGNDTRINAWPDMSIDSIGKRKRILAVDEDKLDTITQVM